MKLGILTGFFSAFLFFLFLSFPPPILAKGHPQFIKLNSETKGTIRKVFACDTSCTFFLTEKVFVREKNSWSRVNLNDVKSVNLFFPLSREDYWYTVNTPYHTSVIYHYKNGHTEKLASPFANEIDACCFFKDGAGIFAGWCEMAVYLNGKISRLPSPPSLREVLKVWGVSQHDFWLRTGNGELFHYSQKAYHAVLPGFEVVDFYFTDNDCGYALCRNKVFKISKGKAKMMFSSDELLRAEKLAEIPGKGLVFTGAGGFLAFWSSGKFEKSAQSFPHGLNDICIGANGETWIGGEQGLLLYSGNRSLGSPPENIPGFSRFKIYKYGGEADDEYGVAIADFNGDGKNDIYSVCIFNPDRLYINNTIPGEPFHSGDGFLEEALKRNALGIPEVVGSGSPAELKLGAGAADIDNDGDEDIYICSLNGRNKLLVNNGKGYFRDVSAQDRRACEDMHRSNVSVFADVDGDGNLDMFVTNEKSSNKLFLNDGNGRFRDITVEAGLATSSGGMCASFADVNNDGLPDLCVSSWFSSDRIYLNLSREGKVRFMDITKYSDLARQERGRSNAVVFADINNDGLSDLFIARRNSPNKLYINKGHGIFRDVTDKYLPPETYLSNGAVFADFDLDGFLDLYVTNVGENIYYKNVNGSHFSDVTDDYGADLSGYYTGCAAGDIDGDGDPDLYVANYIGGISTLFVNNSDPRNSAKFILHGTSSNRDAIGSKITLYRISADGRMEIAGSREISGGSGYGSISAKEAIFGLQPGSRYSAVVTFPAAHKSITIDQVKPGDVLDIREETGFSAQYSLFGKSVRRFFTDPEDQVEILKYLIALSLVTLSVFIQRKKSFARPGHLIIIYLLILLSFISIDILMLYENPWYAFVFPLAVVLILLIILHLVIERVLVRRAAEKEKQQVRENISRDLHDDLASTLGSISIYSSTLKENGTSAFSNEPHIASKIAELSASALQSISDIIWITSPRHDSLQSLLSKIRNYYYDLFVDNNIDFSADVESPEKDTLIPEKLRQNIFLILKETANNIIKHSGAKHVDLIAFIRNGMCTILVKDNGNGFISSADNTNNSSSGNGLVNMRRRAFESSVLLEIKSQPGVGTEICICFKITQIDH